MRLMQRRHMLKQSQFALICFNKIGKMLKQIIIDKDICNNWKKLGDKTGAQEGWFEAFFCFSSLLQHPTLGGFRCFKEISIKTT